VSRLSRQCGILNISQPYRPPLPVTGTALLLYFYFFYFDHRNGCCKVYHHISQTIPCVNVAVELYCALRACSWLYFIQLYIYIYIYIHSSLGNNSFHTGPFHNVYFRSSRMLLRPVDVSILHNARITYSHSTSIAEWRSYSRCRLNISITLPIVGYPLASVCFRIFQSNFGFFIYSIIIL
jgi:hypothetical protein